MPFPDDCVNFPIAQMLESEIDDLQFIKPHPAVYKYLLRSSSR